MLSETEADLSFKKSFLTAISIPHIGSEYPLAVDKFPPPHILPPPPPPRPGGRIVLLV